MALTQNTKFISHATKYSQLQSRDETKVTFSLWKFSDIHIMEQWIYHSPESEFCCICRKFGFICFSFHVDSKKYIILCRFLSLQWSGLNIPRLPQFELITIIVLDHYSSPGLTIGTSLSKYIQTQSCVSPYRHFISLNSAVIASAYIAKFPVQGISNQNSCSNFA